MRILIIIGILIKTLIDIIFGLTFVLFLTMVGFSVTFVYEKLKSSWYEIKQQN